MSQPKQSQQPSRPPRKPKFPTIADVARRAGVSTSTVSYVMNNRNRVSAATRRRVLKAIEELGYRPNNAAQSLATRQMESLGIVVPLSPEAVFSDPFFSEILRGIGRATHRHHYTMVLSMVAEDELYATGAHLLRSKRADGLIIVDPRGAQSQIPQLVDEGFPVVVIGRQEDPRVMWVDVDNVSGGYQAARHLLEGREDGSVAIISGPREHPSACDRLTGYRRALEEFGYAWDDVALAYGDFSEKSGYECMRQLLGKRPPRRVLAANDLMAAGAYQAIAEAGLSIPGDVAVVGFDDLPYGNYLTPPLTTVRQPTAELGETAGEMLLAALEGKDAPASVTLPVSLVIRGSSDPYGR